MSADRPIERPPRRPDAFMVARDQPVVLFCNGPQCSSTPQAIAVLLDAGHPAEMLRYYRGGVHDRVTLGLPLTG